MNSLKSELKSDIQALKGDIQALKGEMQALKGDLQALKGEMQTLKGDVALKSDIQALKNELRQEMQELRIEMLERIEKVETSLLTEFHKWGSTSDIRTRQVVSHVAMHEERLLNAEDRITYLERKSHTPPPPAN